MSTTETIESATTAFVDDAVGNLVAMHTVKCVRGTSADQVAFERDLTIDEQAQAAIGVAAARERDKVEDIVYALFASRGVEGF